ncbi:MAG: dynamin family protein [Paracoccaceae bacterium]|nr:dynamin family protein [Paracoccaceae bacterium]
MIESDDISTEAPQPANAKPCIALMGEFSAGKSTLTNLLIGAQSLPVQVTATQLPPVWIAFGDQPPYRVDLDGNVMPVDLNQLGEISVEDTAYIRIYRKSEVLELCDIIDMPGISDPSMAATVWQRVIHHATAVIWCTHATQAWRQSEAAVWDSMPPELHMSSLLLLTRMDKIVAENDRTRLLRRVRKETDGLFADVLPVSLLQALEAGDDKEAWAASGAEHFTERLLDLLHGEGDIVRRPRASRSTERPEFGLIDNDAAETDPAATMASGTVSPKRVTPRTGLRPSTRRSERPAARAVNAH